MKYILSFVLVSLATGSLCYHLAGPSPRVTLGDSGRDQWTPAQFSPDGKTILARGYQASTDPERPFEDVLKLWDATSGRVLRIFAFSGAMRTQRIDKVGFSPDGKLVVACGQDLPLVVWETETTKELLILHGKNVSAPEKGSPIEQFSFTPDGPQIVTINGDLLRTWNSKTGKMLRDSSIEDYHRGPFEAGTYFSKGGKYLVLDSGTQVSIWDFATLQMTYLGTAQNGHFPEKEFRLPTKGAILGRALSPDGQGILIATRDGKLAELDLATTKEKRSFQLNNAKDTHVVAISPKGDKIMTSGFKGQTVVYSFPECKELNSMPGYGRVQFSPDGKTALTFTKDGRMMLWDLDK